LNPEATRSFHQGESVQERRRALILDLSSALFSANMLARSTSRFFVSSPDPPNALDSRTPQFASWIFRRRFAAFFFAKGRVRAQTRTRGRARPRAAALPAQTRALANTRRLARGGRVSAPRARVSPVVRDARTAPRGGDARDIPAVSVIKSAFVSNAEATRRDDGRGVTRAVAGR
jgi:hypothetical protein